MHTYRPLIGLQNPVIGYADPFHPQSSLQYLRTGEQQQFPIQDPTPSPEEYLALIKTLGADFYMHHSIPEPSEIRSLIRTLDKNGLPFILGNEFYSINGPYSPGTSRGDYPAELVSEAAKSSRFLGLLYDETEHRQLHSTQYNPNAKGYEWADPNGKSADQIEADIVSEIEKTRAKYGNTPLFSEHVFPVMYHTFCRGGINPCPKLLKEEYQPLQIAVSLGAAKQYKRHFSVCVDLWGFDVGNWFTRLWGFPAHSPEEFDSALKLAWQLSPYMMFTENIDPLARNTPGGFVLTEFGKVQKHFREQFVPAHPLPYSHLDAKCDIAVIRPDDACISRTGNFDSRGLYGSADLLPDEKTGSFFDVMHVLLHRTISNQAVTYFQSGHTEWPAANYKRTPEALSALPLPNGVGIEEEKTYHPIFHPMNSTLVFDQYAKPDDIGDASLIIVCGTRLGPDTAAVVAKKAEQGATAVIAGYFYEEFKPFLSNDNIRRLHFVENFLCPQFLQTVEPYLGSPEEWSLRFGEYRLMITNPSKDGRTLEFKLNKE